jgi:hypothetical protein
MNPMLCRGLLLALSTAAASAAPAQPRPAAGTAADPLDAQATVPPATYRSSLAQHRRLGDEKAVPWRVANDTVGSIGGWRAYAREAARDATPPAAAASTPSNGTRAPHGDHKTR